MYNVAASLILPKAAARCQQLLLNDAGYIIESDDRIFPAFNFKAIPVTAWLPFMESIFHCLQALRPEDQELCFNHIFPDVPPLTGFYDFSFMKVEMDLKIMLVWSIHDTTAICMEKLNRQQSLHEKWLRESDL